MSRIQSVVPRGEWRFRLLKNKVLMRIFELQGEEVTE
jgi:hypothetical protein